MALNTELFKIRAIQGARRTIAESNKILSNLNLRSEDLAKHQELTEFMEEFSHSLESFVIEQGLRR